MPCRDPRTSELIDTMTEARLATTHRKLPNLGGLCCTFGFGYDQAKAPGVGDLHHVREASGRTKNYSESGDREISLYLRY